MSFYDINDDSYEAGYTEMTKPRYLQAEYSLSGKAQCRGCNKKLQLRELRIVYIQHQTEHFHASKKYVHLDCLRKIQDIGHIFKRMNIPSKFKQIQGLSKLIPLDQKQVIKTLEQLLKQHKNGKLKKGKEDQDQEFELSDEQDDDDNEEEDNEQDEDSPIINQKRKANKALKVSTKAKVLKPVQQKKEIQKNQLDSDSDSNLDGENPKKYIKFDKPNYLTVNQFNQVQNQLIKSKKLKTQIKNQQLDKNNFYTFKKPDENSLNYFHAEAVILGGVPNCQACGAGKLKFFGKLSEYQCMGFEDEDGKFDCGQKYMFDEIKRVKWVN